MSLERIIAGFMKYGAFTAVGLVLVGMLVMAWSSGLPSWSDMSSLKALDYWSMIEDLDAAWLAIFGLVALVAVSVGRLLLCAVLFLHDGDPHFAVISVVTAGIVAAAAFFRLLPW